MDKELYLGLKFKKEIKVGIKDTANTIGSGTVEVFATPKMILLMEEISSECVQAYLDKEFTTVGTKVDIVHIAATPAGMEVYATTELIGIDGKKLTFKVEAYDQKEKIGEGIHERFIINKDRFMDKVNSKVSNM
jgi:predicted thioesterase